MSVELFVVYMRPPCQSGASQNFKSLSVGWYWIVDQVKAVSNWISSKVQLFITYQVLVLLFLYFRRDFACTWKDHTKTLATTLSTSRVLRHILFTHFQTRFFHKTREHVLHFDIYRVNAYTHNSAKIDRHMPEKSCWSQAQIKEEGGYNAMRLLSSNLPNWESYLSVNWSSFKKRVSLGRNSSHVQLAQFWKIHPFWKIPSLVG